VVSRVKENLSNKIKEKFSKSNIKNCGCVKKAKTASLHMYSFGDYPKAMELLMESEKNAEKIKNKRNPFYAGRGSPFCILISATRIKSRDHLGIPFA
jgi:hypothetical protein